MDSTDNAPMIKIIEYDPKYAKEVKDFIENIAVSEFGLHRARPDLDNVLEVYAKPSGNFWLAIDLKNNDQVIGTLGLQKWSENRGYVRRMYVGETFRGTGLAKQLLERLLSVARENKYETLFLDSSIKMTRAHHFYEKNHFYQIENPFDKDDPQHQDQYFYEKKLN